MQDLKNTTNLTAFQVNQQKAKEFNDTVFHNQKADLVISIYVNDKGHLNVVCDKDLPTDLGKGLLAAAAINFTNPNDSNKSQIITTN